MKNQDSIVSKIKPSMESYMESPEVIFFKNIIRHTLLNYLNRFNKEVSQSILKELKDTLSQVSVRGFFLIENIEFITTYVLLNDLLVDVVMEIQTHVISESFLNEIVICDEGDLMYDKGRLITVIKDLILNAVMYNDSTIQISGLIPDPIKQKYQIDEVNVRHVLNDIWVIVIYFLVLDRSILHDIEIKIQ